MFGMATFECIAKILILFFFLQIKPSHSLVPIQIVTMKSNTLPARNQYYFNSIPDKIPLISEVNRRLNKVSMVTPEHERHKRNDDEPSALVNPPHNYLFKFRSADIRI